MTFSKVTATTDGVATTDELNVVLSLGKFTSGFDCNNNYINASSRPNVLEPYITTGKKATIKWTMLDDGLFSQNGIHHQKLLLRHLVVIIGMLYLMYLKVINLIMYYQMSKMK